MCISKRIKWILKKATVKKFFLHIFQSTHQVGTKNVVECYKEFFGYFNALETNGEYIGIEKISAKECIALQKALDSTLFSGFEGAIRHLWSVI